MYPAGEGHTFDMDYYCSKHIPMVLALTGAACKKAEVELGLSGGVPGSAAPYLAIGHMYFDSMADFAAGFVPHIPKFNADIPNYTNSTPVAQISRIMDI
jgi:uncharacterized protein (TIGR02118 family)